MGQQHRKVAKRRRRINYIKRKKELAQANSTMPVRLAVSVAKKEAAAAKEAPAKKAPVKKAAAAKPKATKPAEEKAAVKKAPAKKTAKPKEETAAE